MTREEIINRIYQNSGISELGEVPFDTSPVETLEDYPYSLPAGASGGFNVPSGGSVGAVGARSFGGGRGGGGFPLMLPNLSGSQPENAEEYAQEYSDAKALEYAAQNAQEYAAEGAESAAERARKAERDRQAVQEIKEQSADITFEKPQIKTDFEQIRARGAEAVEEMRRQGEILRGERLSAEQMASAPEAQQMQFKEQSADITFEKPQIKTDFEQIRARGAEAVEEMRKQGEILRGERLSTEQMASAPEAQQMQFGRFADTARAEQAVRRANPNADAQQIKAKAEEIAEKTRRSAEPITQEDLQITYKDYRTPQLERIKEASSGTFGRNQTQVAVSGRDFSDVNAIKNYERNLQGVSSVSPNQKIQDNRNVFQKAFDYMTKTAQQSAENPLIGLGAYGLAAPALAALPLSGAASAAAPVASNVLQFPTAAKVASGAGAAGTVLNFASRAAAESPASSGYGRFAPTVWNAETRSVDAITSAAPKVTTPVSTPSLSSGIKSAAQNVANKLNEIRTNTNKLTTKEKRLGGL